MIILALCGCNQPIREEDKLAEHLMKSLADVKISEFRKACLSQDDLRELTVQTRKIPGLEDAKDDALLRTWDEYQLLISEMFRSIIDEGVQMGIRWKKIEVLSVVPGSEVIEDFIPPAIKMLNDLSIRFTDGSSTYLIRFYDPVRIQDNWKISSHLYLLHKEG